MGGVTVCVCGYRGPSVTDDGREVCPICHTPAGPRGEKLRVPCPRGHVLTVDQALIGRQVVCPRCNEFFVPRAEDGVERRREIERMRREAEARAAERWVVRAVIAVVAVVLAVFVMIIVAATRR